MKGILFALVFMTITSVSFGNEFNNLKNSFGDWQVRHVYNQDSLHYRFSDAKTKIHLNGHGSFPFQINRDYDGEFSFTFEYAVGRWKDISTIDGWLTKVTFLVDDETFVFTSDNKVIHTFYGKVDSSFLMAIAQASSIQLELFVEETKVSSGSISTRGSFAALNYIRAL
jgi:hypothetical protein